MSVNGVRSGDLPWETAEAAMLMARCVHMLKASAWSNIRELVLITSRKQREECRGRLSLTLQKTMGGDTWYSVPRDSARRKEPTGVLLPGSRHQSTSTPGREDPEAGPSQHYEDEMKAPRQS